MEINSFSDLLLAVTKAISLNRRDSLDVHAETKRLVTNLDPEWLPAVEPKDQLRLVWLPSDVADPAIGTLDRLQLWKARVPGTIPAAGKPAADPPEKQNPPPVGTEPSISQPSTEALALALKADNPAWSDEKIAKAAGCHRSTLYTFPKYMAAKEILANGKKTRPRGTKHDGIVEAWHEEEGDG